MTTFPPDFVQPTNAEQDEVSRSVRGWSDDQLGDKAYQCEQRHNIMGGMLQDSPSASDASRLNMLAYTNSLILGTVMREQGKRLAQTVPEGFQVPDQSEISSHTDLLFLTHDQLNGSLKRLEDRGQIIDELSVARPQFSAVLAKWRLINDRCIALFERELGLRRLLAS